MAPTELPSDAIFEILTRTQLKSLDACKCVSKEWRQLVEDPDFMPTYCRRTNNVSGFIIQGLKYGKRVSTFVSIDESSKPPIRFLPSHVNILSSCNQGLLCCGMYTKNCRYRYYICKPTTGQWQALPNPKLRYWTPIPLGMVVLRSSPLHFKIVRLSYRGITRSYDGNQFRCEVFDSMPWRWKESQTLILPTNSGDEGFLLTETSILVIRSFHWLTTRNNVVAFHEPTESFYKFPLPEPMMRKDQLYRAKKVVNYQGRLGASWLTKELKVELWLMDGSPMMNQADWRMHLEVDVGNLRSIFKYPTLVGFYNRGILVFKEYNVAIFYRVEDCSFITVKLGADFLYSNDFFQFRSDVETVCFRA